MSPLLSEAYSFGQDAALELFFKEAASLTQLMAGMSGAAKPLSNVTRQLPRIPGPRPAVPAGHFGKNTGAAAFMQNRDAMRQRMRPLPEPARMPLRPPSPGVLGQIPRH
jgi:hypothetical protein